MPLHTIQQFFSLQLLRKISAEYRLDVVCNKFRQENAHKDTTPMPKKLAGALLLHGICQQK